MIQSLFVRAPSFLLTQLSQSRWEWTWATMPPGPMPIDSIRPLKGVVEVGASGGRTFTKVSRAVIGGAPAMSGPSLSSGFHHPTALSCQLAKDPLSRST